MIPEVSFANSSPFVILAIFVWTLVVAKASYDVAKHAIVGISQSDPFRFNFKSIGAVLLDVLILGAALVTAPTAEHRVLEWLYLVANPDVTSVGIWSQHPWWAAMIVGPLVGSAVAAIRDRQHHEAE